MINARYQHPTTVPTKLNKQTHLPIALLLHTVTTSFASRCCTWGIVTPSFHTGFAVPVCPRGEQKKTMVTRHRRRKNGQNRRDRATGHTTGGPPQTRGRTRPPLLKRVEKYLQVRADCTWHMLGKSVHIANKVNLYNWQMKYEIIMLKSV